jgi:hypothetical protein
MKQSVQNFLLKNKYFVSLTKANSDTYCLLTPEKELTVYTVLKGARQGVTIGEAGNPTFLGLPEHGVRLIIICDIVAKCRAIGYSEDHIFLYDGHELIRDKTCLSFLPEPVNIEERTKEGDLLEIFKQAIKTNFLPYYGSRAKEKGVYIPYYLSELYLKDK